MNPRLILFDVDGTLVDTMGAGRRAMERAFLEVFGIESIARHARQVRFAGMTDRGIVEALGNATGIRSSWWSPEMVRLRTTYLEALRDEMKPQPGRVLAGVGALLEALSDREDARMGLLTGNLECGARIKLEPFDLNRFFPDGGFGSKYRDRRDVARVARARLSTVYRIPFEGDRVVVVGDTENDVDCAKANGFRSVAVDSGWSTRESLQCAGPDVLLDDLSNLDRSLAALGF